MLIEYKSRPPDLPKEYGKNPSVYECAICRKDKEFSDGVWRCEMMKFLDICPECAKSVSTQGIEKRESPQHPTNRSDVNFLHVGTGGIPSIEQDESDDRLILMTNAIKKELARAIEDMDEEKFRRFDNLKHYTDVESPEYERIIAETRKAEEELNTWRRDRQQQEMDEENRKLRMLRNEIENDDTTMTSVGVIGPAQPDDPMQGFNAKRYDPNEDFAIIHARLKGNCNSIYKTHLCNLYCVFFCVLVLGFLCVCSFFVVLQWFSLGMSQTFFKKNVWLYAYMYSMFTHV